MANLTESYEWPDGIHEWAEDEFIEGGPDGPDNVPPRQLAERTQFLAAEGLLCANLAGMGVNEGHKTIRQRMQEGAVTIYNRGVKAGCTASRKGTERKVVLAVGTIFGKGLEMPCLGDQDGIVVPPNTGETALVYYGY
ncbi:MAG: hypothetical protein LBQ88_11395 [Treponema sp.]|jgi:hypothetical protein|nr:hypothetical protein [Treponema sp.]